MPTSLGSLGDLVVVDLTRVLGGPYCTQLLGDHGAEVIKVERPRATRSAIGDRHSRAMTPPTSSGSIATSARSGSICEPTRGGPSLLRLLERADILIENYKPGAMENWGLGYDHVLAPSFPA